MLKKLIAGICFVAMLTMTAQAMPNWLNELQERVENSPMEAAGILVESLVSGVVEVEVNNLGWAVHDDRTMFRLYSNLLDADYALFMHILDRWVDMEIDVFSNTERLAMRVSELGDYVLGVRYATLGDDLLTFMNQLHERGYIRELPPASEMEMVLGYVNMFTEFLASDAAFEFNPLDFADLFLLLALRAQRDTAQVTINSGGEEVDVQRAEISVGAETIIDVILALIDRMYINTMREMGMDQFLWIFEEIRDELAAERDYVQGSATFATYTDETGRMRRVSFAIVEYDPFIDEMVTSLSIDFGTNATDAWVIEIVDNNSWSTNTNVVVWEVLHTNELRVHQFASTSTNTTRWREEPWTEEFALTLAWNPATGVLALTFKEGGDLNAFEETIEGTFTMANGGFALQLADEYGGVSFSAAAGTPVPSPAFINLDRWADIPFIRALFTDTPSQVIITPIEIFEILPTELEPVEIIVIDQELLTPVVELAVAEEIVLGPVAVVANCHYLHLRRGPGASHAAFNHLPAGYVVTILEVRGNWVQVSTSRGTGWVFSRYLEFYVR